jgi:preprotein translocase subunit YajC
MTTHMLFALLFAPSGQDAGGGLMFLIGQLALIFAIFYFLVIRPQRRQQAQHRQLLASLQRGDQIVTTGGVVGEVIHIKDDQVTIRSGESRLVVVRSGIANITNRTASGAKAEEKAEAKSR